MEILILFYLVILGSFIVWGLFNEKKLIRFEKKVLYIIKCLWKNL